MTEQIQCLNCGQSRISTQPVTVDQKSGKPIDLTSLIVGVILTPPGICMMVSAFLSTGTGAIWIVLPMSLVLLLIGGFLIGDYAIHMSRRAKSELFKCEACRYRWTRRQQELGRQLVTCPNCGKLSASTKTIAVFNRQSRAELPDRASLWGMSALSLLGAMFFLILAYIAIPSRTSITLIILLQWIVVLALGIGVLRLIIGPIRLFIAYYRVDKVTLTEHQCVACNHKWQQEDGQVQAAPMVSTPTNEEKSAGDQ